MVCVINNLHTSIDFYFADSDNFCGYIWKREWKVIFVDCIEGERRTNNIGTARNHAPNVILVKCDIIGKRRHFYHIFCITENCQTCEMLLSWLLVNDFLLYLLLRLRLRLIKKLRLYFVINSFYSFITFPVLLY